MNVKIKKLLAVLLSILVLASALSVAFGAYAQDVSVSEVDTETTYEQFNPDENHTTFFRLIIDFFKSVGKFFKYIFYDIWLGVPAEPAPTLPSREH